MRKNYCGIVENFDGQHVSVQQEKTSQDAQKVRPARPQASRRPEAYPQGYVEDFDEPRTKLADFFSILLGFGFAVIQMPMLPVEPGMAKFVGKNVAPSRQG